MAFKFRVRLRVQGFGFKGLGLKGLKDRAVGLGLSGLGFTVRSQVQDRRLLRMLGCKTRGSLFRSLGFRV